MFKRISFTAAFIGFLILLASCEKEDVSPPETGSTSFQTLVVTVKECDPNNDPFCENATLYAGAQVKLFASEQDRDLGEPIIGNQITGSGGQVTFGGLDTFYYWLSIKPGNYPLHYGAESIPPGGTAYYEHIVY